MTTTLNSTQLFAPEIEQLNSDLQKALEKVRKRRNFDVKDWINKKTDMLNDYMSKCKLKAIVVSASGGVDSACTLAIAKAASKKPNSPIQRVVGIAQPIKSTEKIWKRALELKDVLGVEMFTVDQSEIHTQLQNVVDTAVGIKGESFATGQLKSYMRTPVGFYVAQLLTQAGTPAVVCGTGNWDEDGYLFYFCKAGDGVSDVQLINDLHKSEVFKVSAELGVPKSILIAPPSADLWESQTDEGELGFTYDFVELLTEFLRYSEEDQKQFFNELAEEGKAQFVKLRKMAETIHLRNKHKEKYPLNLNIL